MARLSSIDLFAGCGGLSLGFSYAGWSGCFAIEKDPMAFETLQKNLVDPDAPYRHFDHWPTWLPKTKHDIRELLASPAYRQRLSGLAGRVSLVAGGPPCQGFSIGGARRGHDERNDLVFRMLDFVSLVRPPMVLIENVEGMARAFKSQPGQHETSVLEVVLDELRGLGYKAGFFVANALDAGVPQNRKRVITFGVTEGLVGDLDPGLLLEAQYKLAGYNQRVQLGLPTDRYTTIGEAIHDLAGDELVVCPDSQEFQSSKYLPAKSQYAKLMRRGKRTGSIPNSHRFSQHGEKVLSLYETALATQSPGRLSKQFLLDNKTKTKKKFLLGEDICASTLTTHPDEHIHYLYPRNVSLREMARIQSFPDDFYFYGRYTLNGDRRKLDVSRCAQIGNAIAPLMASALGIAVRESYELLVATDRGERLKKLKESTAIGETVPLFL